MHIQALHISNFRGIRDVSITDLGTMVVIAGQNGSGKSCLFDAIRLLKSVYGGYQQNEWQQWMGEFQIRLTNQSSDFAPMFNDPTKPLRISCDFRLSEEERTYISTQADELLKETTWRSIIPEAYEWGGFRMASFATQFREREAEATSRVTRDRPKLMAELANQAVHGECLIPVGSTPLISESVALSVIFSTFRPQEIGVIDYHGAQRNYGRELVQGINLNLEAGEKQRSQSALYNYASKYNNVKSEMAASYVKEILAEQAGIPKAEQSTLTNTLKELFANFFPDKEFLGPQPTKGGGLSFPVKTASGTFHDLDELSAGEKEILYGYLRIRNSAPKHSIILLDEPELHLNPRLIRGLPQFYHKHLGKGLGNQIWLVTHSDALLREVVGRIEFSVFHMLPCANVGPKDSQLKQLLAHADLELALVDLVGDLAAYRPHGKVIIFEGGGDSDFDQHVAGMLFPELHEKANLISGSNKVRVRALHDLLSKASAQGQLPFTFYSITDHDSEADADTRRAPVNSYSWDVYHIENYFLDPKFIGQVLKSIGDRSDPREETIWDELRACARETLIQLVRHELSKFANDSLIRAINVTTDPKTEDLAGETDQAVDRSLRRIAHLRGAELHLDKIRQKEEEIRGKLEESLANGQWVKTFRGREVLRRFCGKRAPSIPYEVFRNLIVARMQDAGHKPAGMNKVISAILNQSQNLGQ